MINSLYYIKAPGLIPYTNQAWEEYLLERLEPGELILYLWQNKRTVVIGRNQNCWKECQVERLRHDHGYVARRLSGGGAVFHDTGNLNFTFLLNSEDYNLSRQLQVIVNALAQLGISSQISGRNDILAEGKKFSGNAFYRRGNKRYHHGTIMVDVAMADLMRYLSPSAEKLAAKGIDSVRSRVINLVQLAPQLTIADLSDALIAALAQVYGMPAKPLQLAANEYDKISQIAEKYSAWQWIYGHQADFNLSRDKRFSWGEISLNLRVENGKISAAAVYSDALAGELIAAMNRCLNGCRYQVDDIVEVLQRLPMSDSGEKQLVADVVSWLRDWQ